MASIVKRKINTPLFIDTPMNTERKNKSGNF